MRDILGTLAAPKTPTDGGAPARAKERHPIPMTRLDVKAIGYGFATFVACTLLMTLAGTVAGSKNLPFAGDGRWAAIRIIGYLAPVVAGYVAARKARVDRILNGTIGGSIGVLLVLAPALAIPGYPVRGIPIILAWYAALAALGAILGNHRADRLAP